MPVGHLYVFVGKMSIQIFCPFLIGLIVFLLMSYLCILGINPLSVISLANIFSHSVSCLFTSWTVSFAMQNLLILIMSHLFIFAFVSFAFGDRSKKYCYDLCQRVFCLCFLVGVFHIFLTEMYLTYNIVYV